MHKKKFVVSLIALVLCICLLSGCEKNVFFGPGMNDWEYPLINEYRVEHISSDFIALIHPTAGEIGSVLRFSYGNRYIAIEVSQNRENEGEYFIIDSKNHQKYGPLYTMEEYNDLLQDLAADDMGEWIVTIPAPKDALFPRIG